MIESIRISSSRTNLFKIVFLPLSIGILYFSSNILSSISFRYWDSISIILLVLLPIALFYLLISLSLTTVKIVNREVHLTNLFPKDKRIINITDIKSYLSKEISLGFLDPLSLNKFFILTYVNSKGGYSKVVVLAPSRFSGNSDIPKQIYTLQQAPNQVPNNW
ncbi:hypothetical protein PEPS_28210 (plasmid) [Persicobacter psychrovividus]|uniref:PH domain-containing protein n=1 Tax=Persicobacter psychrovividus TaxID=387638 RepID=A0ABN6LBF9_9BACT|nr:hypothetical protein PEPS_28210 [Persicobacter psychrovividus]